MVTALTIIQVILCLVLVAVVMLQSGKSAGLSGAIAGGADTFLSKNKAKSLDAKLAKGTKWVCAVWLVLTLVLNLLPASAPAADADVADDVSTSISEVVPTEGDASDADVSAADASTSAPAASSTEETPAA